MVWIADGAPRPKHDIRLGDVVVSFPGSRHGGVIQYDFVMTVQKENSKELVIWPLHQKVYRMIYQIWMLSRRPR